MSAEEPVTEQPVTEMAGLGKVIALVLMIAVIAFGPSACRNDDEPVPTTSYSAEDDSVLTGESYGDNPKDVAFVTTVEANTAYDDGQWALINIGASVCSDYRAGKTTLTIATDLMAEHNLSPHDAGYIIGAATSAYCPEYDQA